MAAGSAGERRLKAVRGAVVALTNTAEAIEEAAGRLVRAVAEANGLAPEDVVSAIFTVTDDLDAQFPAVGARKAGWDQVALLCAREIPVPGSLPRCIRLLVHTHMPADRPVHHVYLDGAEHLRPDWVPAEGRDGGA